MVRRRRESNPCTGLCRPLPKPLGHSAAQEQASRTAVTPPRRGFRGIPGGATAILAKRPWAAEQGVKPKPRLRADDGIRTRDPHLGKVMLSQLSHVRMPVRGY